MENWNSLTVQLDDLLESLRQQRGLPSLSAAASIGQEIIWKKACGLADLETSRSATTEMVYPLGSISKVFIAVMLMQLVERGIVALEDPVTRYIPEYQVRSPFAGAPPTTLRQLAAHTAGLPRDAAIHFPMNLSLGEWEFSAGKSPPVWYRTPEEVLACLKTVELELPPDTAKRYSNLGVMLLGIALERASGQDFRTYLSEHIFRPLDMRNAGFVDEPSAWDARFPTGYGRTPGGDLFIAPRWQLGSAIYTGGIYATAAELARFCAAFDLPGSGEDQPAEILTPGSIQRMIHPDAMGDANLGWWRGWHADYPNYGHAGAHVGFISTALFVPELHLSVAVQANRWNPIFDTQDSTVVARELLSFLIPWREQSRPAFDPARVSLGRYCGWYHLPGDYAAAQVIEKDGLLEIILNGMETTPMRFAPVGPDSFGPSGTQFPAVVFQTGGGGEVKSFEYALFRFNKSRP